MSLTPELAKARDEIREHAKAAGLSGLGYFRAFVTAGVDPAIMGIGPVPAIRKLLAKTGMKMDQMKMGDMKMMEDMAAKKKANTERINALMATVTSAKGETKVAAMADVISVLLEERAAMQEHCAAMMNMMKMMHSEVKH